MPASVSRSPLAAALTDVQSSDHDSSAHFEDLLRQLDEQFAALKAPLAERFQFQLDGAEIDVRRIKQPNGYRFLISAVLGYLPYSIESPERRQAVRAIVAATKSLQTVHFSIDHTSKVYASGMLDIPETVSPDLIFYPLMIFLQEAQPFMQLIKRYL